MKKWNTIVFLCYIAYCVFFFFLFWYVFDNNDLFHKYYNLAFNGLLTTVGVNSLVQIIAIIAKRKFAIRWLFGGFFVFLNHSIHYWPKRMMNRVSLFIIYHYKN